MSGITDYQDVEVFVRAPQKPRLGERKPGRRLCAGPPLVRVRFPDRDVPLDDVDACASQRRDHLSVPRVVALVRAEVEDAQRFRSPFVSAPAQRVRARTKGAPGLLPTTSLTRISERMGDAIVTKVRR